MIGGFQVGPFQLAYQQQQQKVVGGHGDSDLDFLFNKRALEAKRLQEYRRRKVLEAEEQRLSAIRSIALLEGQKEASRAEHARAMAEAEAIRIESVLAKGRTLGFLRQQQRQAEARAKAAEERRLAYESEQQRQKLEMERLETIRKEEDEASEAVAFLMSSWDEFFPKRKH